MQQLERSQPALAQALHKRDMKQVVQEIKNSYRAMRTVCTINMSGYTFIYSLYSSGISTTFADSDGSFECRGSTDDARPN